MDRVFNWFGIAAGVVTLVLIAVSFFVPWWQLTVGDSIFTVYASPIYTNFGMLGHQFTIPLLWALNLGLVLTFAAAGIIMLIYSIIPTKPYAKHLLGFSYRKPLWALISFLVGLIVMVAFAGALNFNVPLVGAGEFALPSWLPLNAQVSASLYAAFLFPCWLAIAAAALCIAARLYHPRIIKKFESQQQTMPSTENTVTV